MVWSELAVAGWKLAKTTAIAGTTVTAAPVVLPPLVIVSAFGLAFSLPSTILVAGGQDGNDELIRVCGSVEGSPIHEGESRKEEYESLSDKVMTLERKTLGDRIDETDMGGTFEKHKYGNDQDITPSPKLQEVEMEEEEAKVDREVLVDEYRVDLSAHTFGSHLHVDVDGEEGVEVPVDLVVPSSITTELRTSMES